MSLINTFIRHKIASHLLMFIMLIAGFWSLLRINIQFRPSVALFLINVNVSWPSGNAENIERAVINPLEEALRHLDNIKTLSAQAENGFAHIQLSFIEGTDLTRAMEQVRDAVDQVSTLPDTADKPVIERVIPYELVAKLVITGKMTRTALRKLAYQFEQSLLASGIAKITLLGVPDEEIAINIPIEKLKELQLSLLDIVTRVRAASQDVPAGHVGGSTVEQALRSNAKRRSPAAFGNIVIAAKPSGSWLHLKDIAQITRHIKPHRAQYVFYGSDPAVELSLLRTRQENSLHVARVLHQWLKTARLRTEKTVRLIVYNERWEMIKDRIQNLLLNAGQGFLIILLLLFVSLNNAVAFWVAMSIPIAFMSACALLYLWGGSVNVYTLFAFIMALGIVVDDAIVVGEEALNQVHKGREERGTPALKGPDIENYVSIAASKMCQPIMASSLTTLCAFLPLFFLRGHIGQMALSIPVVIFCVICTSLLDSFFVLPGHLSHSFKKENRGREPLFRQWFNRGFLHFKDHLYRPFLCAAMRYKALTISLIIALFLFSIGLLLSGQVPYRFFPEIEEPFLTANIEFLPGTPEKKRRAFLQTVSDAAEQAQKTLMQSVTAKQQKAAFVIANVSFLNYRLLHSGTKGQQDDQSAAVFVELVPENERPIDNATFIRTWQSTLPDLPDFVTSMHIITGSIRSSNKDLDLVFSGDDLMGLKSLAETLKTKLHTYKSLFDIRDDLPLSQQHIVFSLTPVGQSLGLTTSSLGQQLQAAFHGRWVQSFYENKREVQVNVRLPDNERQAISSLQPLPIRTPGGHSVPLAAVAAIHYEDSPHKINHTDAKRTVHVTARLKAAADPGPHAILTDLQRHFLPALLEKYGVSLSLKGKSLEEKEMITDMKHSGMIGLVLIFIILAWSFESYFWPLIIMIAIPLGLTGAIIGHWVMHIQMTVLSLLGFFGLSGIVINDTIILFNEYRILKRREMAADPALIEAACRRLRPVLLTSATTVCGLIPLLLEDAPHVRTLIPMATSLAFGLAYATVIILLLMPILLSVYETYAYSRARVGEH